eukprot:1646626-Amphidinium_carterae.1
MCKVVDLPLISNSQVMCSRHGHSCEGRHSNMLVPNCVLLTCTCRLPEQTCRLYKGPELQER